MCLTVRRASLGLLIGVLWASTASAGVINLFDWAFNIDGVTHEDANGDLWPLMDNLDGEGLGTLEWSTSSTGSHSFLAFFDHEIDETINTFFNEYGEAFNTPAAGQSWEIDEPGYIFGDIYDNFLANTLDNSNNVPPGLNDDVSLAMGWNFSISSGQTATITLDLGRTEPASGFYLKHADPDSPDEFFFSSALDITGGGPPVIPEPATMALLGLGALVMLGARRRRKA
jgi:hypothetical protein